MVTAYGTVSTGTYNGKKSIYVLMWNGGLEFCFDYRSMNLVQVDDAHTGEWITYEKKDELEWARKYYNRQYTYARRKAREFKESKTKKRK